MPQLRRRWLPLLFPVVVAIVLVAWWAGKAPAASTGSGGLAVRVKHDDFRVMVNTTGELRARKFVQIQGPANAQQAEVWQMRISSIVPEGTVVKAGEVVAELDRSQIAAKASEVALALQKAEALYTQAQLDSALTLSQAREELRNLEFVLEEKRLAREQAQYEAPTIRRQVEIDYERTQRQLEQAKVTYRTRTQQSTAKMREVGADLERQRNRLAIVQEVMQSFVIRAPTEGMVIYVREWNGRKKGVGSQVSAWDPTVATLPDLMLMESVTYVNEIDVRRLAVGQPVAIALDADPDKRLTGTITAVANVGEQRPNTDAKVFEVKISIAESDSTLRPGMTTSNAIESAVIANALFVPIEAVTNDGTNTFVFRQERGRVVRQQVVTGAMNDNEIIVVRGLSADDLVLLAPPPASAKVATVMLPDEPGAPGSDQPVSEEVPVVTAERGRGADTSAASPRPRD